MSNHERGEVTIEAGGQVYRLRLSLNAMCELETALSTPDKPVTFLEVLGRLNRRTSMSDVRWIVWAALREHHPDMTVADAGNLVDESGGVFAFSKRLEMITASAQPDPKDVEVLEAASGDPRPAQAIRGVGGRSSSKRAASA